MVRAGFIGLGSQGAPMAERMLAAGHELTVWARRPEAADDLVAKGAHRAASVTELGKRCDHIGVCVVDDAGVEEICAQLLPVMKPGNVLVIHSTILPQTCERLAAEAEKRGIALLDAPVSGGGAGAAAGSVGSLVSTAAGATASASSGATASARGGRPFRVLRASTTLRSGRAIVRDLTCGSMSAETATPRSIAV